MTLLLALMLTMTHPMKTTEVSGMLGGLMSRAGKTNMYVMRPMAWRGDRPVIYILKINGTTIVDRPRMRLEAPDDP